MCRWVNLPQHIHYQKTNPNTQEWSFKKFLSRHTQKPWSSWERDEKYRIQGKLKLGHVKAENGRGEYWVCWVRGVFCTRVIICIRLDKPLILKKSMKLQCHRRFQQIIVKNWFAWSKFMIIRSKQLALQNLEIVFMATMWGEERINLREDVEVECN